MGQGYYRLITGPQVVPHRWTGITRLGPQREASSQSWRRASRNSWRPSLVVTVASRRTVRPVSAKQEPPVQPPPQQQQDSWLQTCRQVAASQQEHGRLPLASADAQGPVLPGERPLGLWCTEQQRRKAGSKGPPLSAEERRALQAIPGWGWWATKRVRKPWEQWRQEVEAFYQQHGRLPRNSAGRSIPFLPGEQALGLWVNGQRNHYKGHMQPPLSAERIAALEGTPGWSWGEYIIEPWEGRYQQLQDFVRQHGRMPIRVRPGRSNPPQPGEKELGNRVRTQRAQYKAQKLSAEQVAALERTPGWFWGEFVVQPWGLRCQQLQDFVQQHGRLPVRVKSGCPSLPGEKELGNWVGTQRVLYKAQKLSAEQITALEATPGWFWAKYKRAK